MSALTQSYKDHRAKIVAKGCFWREGVNGWYHCYEGKAVKQKIKDMDDLIAAGEGIWKN